MISNKRIKVVEASPGRDLQYALHAHEGIRMKDYKREQFIINAEVSEMVLNQLDFGRQKICRLICKSLNQEFCRLVAVKGVVVYFKDRGSNKKIADFKETFQRGRELFPSLPSPFQNTSFIIFAGHPGLSDYTQLLLECPEIYVTKLHVESLGQEAVAFPKEQLEMIAPTLTELKSCYWSCFADDHLAPLRFPNLKKLMIIALDESLFYLADSSVEEDWKKKELKFWSSVIGLAPNLVAVEVQGLDLMQELFQLCDLTLVQTIALENVFGEKSQTNPLHAIRTKAGHLTGLNFSFDMIEGIQRDEIYAVIAHFSNSLKSVRLEFRGNASWKHFPYCPALSRLALKAVDVDRFPWGTVPMLRSICARRMVASGNGATSSKELIPCLSVQHVRLNGRSDYLQISARLFYFLPNATSWDINASLLPGFCEAAAACDANIQRLGLKPSFFFEEPNATLGLDLTACLKQLPYLLEVDVNNHGNTLTSPLSIRFNQLPHIKILQWLGPSHESKSSFKELPKHLSSLERFEFDQVSHERFDADVEEFIIAFPRAFRFRKPFDPAEIESCFGHYS